jgi:glyoxylase-like metal-dependent hydrolase (beta-lactamase superfamily II)
VNAIEIGRIRVHPLNDGFFAMDGGAMFGIVPKPLWAREVPADERNRIRMSLHCPLAIDGKDVALIDTGLGDRLSEREREIYAVDRQGGLVVRLRELGLEPEDVTQVVLTHLHFDHVGGVVTRDETGRLHAAFPRARLFIQRGEIEAALSQANERIAAAYRHVPECLEPWNGRIELLDGATPITPRLRVVVTGGHTPSHQCPVFEDAGTAFVHLGDVAPTRAHLRPAWNQAYDVDPLGTIEAKRTLLERAERERWWVSFDHDAHVACGRLDASSTRSGALAESVAISAREAQD